MIDAEDLEVTLPHEHLLTDFFAMRNNRDYDRYYDQLPNELTKDVFTLTKEHPISVILPYAEAEIDLDDILEAKKNAPVFQDRRPSEYKALVE